MHRGRLRSNTDPRVKPEIRAWLWRWLAFRGGGSWERSHNNRRWGRAVRKRPLSAHVTGEPCPCTRPHSTTQQTCGAVLLWPLASTPGHRGVPAPPNGVSGHVAIPLPLPLPLCPLPQAQRSDAASSASFTPSFCAQPHAPAAEGEGEEASNEWVAVEPSKFQVQFGKYTLGPTIGRGSFGKVKVAVHTLTGQKVRTFAVHC